MLPLTPFVVLFLAAFLYAPLSSDSGIIDNDGASRVLLLTAHPDDEAMFFAPTILALNSNGRSNQVDASGQTVLSQPDQATPNLFSLCLSTGNADGLGAIRSEELSQSLDILGVGRDKRWLVDNPYVAQVFVLYFRGAHLSNLDTCRTISPRTGTPMLSQKLLSHTFWSMGLRLYVTRSQLQWRYC